MVGSMIPTKYDLHLYRGDSAGLQFKLWQDSSKTVAVNLSGATVASEVRDKPSGSKIVPLTCTVTLPNIIDVTINAAVSAACPPKGVWDLQITYADGQVQTPVAGSVFVTADVTMSTV
jgi:hypothetical protein